MLNLWRHARLAAGLFLGAMAVGSIFLVSCSAPGAPNVHPATATAASQPASSPEYAKGAAQLWAENCSRCHNSRDPSSYSDSQWDVVMHHMRVRANLTAEEEKRILEFLKASN